ncbi:MAG: hypothetical protein ABJC13_16810 [Acidobacteriota bacterium]
MPKAAASSGDSDLADLERFPAPPAGRRRGALILAALPPVATSLALLLLYDLARHPAFTLLALGLGAAGLWFSVRRLERLADPPISLGPAILFVALLIRLPLIALPPTLSDDALRYLWDGRVAAAGFNPYQEPPDSPGLVPLRDELWNRLPHRQVPTVYPPLALSAFSIAARFPVPMPRMPIWKLLACAADFGACALLLALARRSGLPEARVAWYAWNPLVVLEVAGMGHVDALGAVACIGAVWAITILPKRPVTAGMAAAAGILAKLAPLAALPMWARQSRRPWIFLLAALGLSGLALAPVIASVGGLPPGLATYGVSWEWNGPLYEPLWRGLEALGAGPAAHAALDAAKTRTEGWTFWNRFYPYAYPRFFAKLLLAAVALAAVAASFRERDPILGTGRLFGRLMLTSATLYPWYLLWVLPWAALREEKRWLLLAALMPLSYIPALFGVPLWPWVYLSIWAPFALFSILGKRWSPS